MPDNSWVNQEYLNSLIQESESHKSRVAYIAAGKRAWKWYYKRVGLVPIDDFDDSEVPGKAATSRDNIIKETVDEALSLFLKNDPVIRRYPHHPQDADLVDDVDALYLSAWRNNGARPVVSSALRESFIGGLSTVKTYWDVKRKQIAFEKIDPSSMFFDPFASNDHRGQDCRYIIHKTRQRLDVVLQRYGDEGGVALGLPGYESPDGKKPVFSDILSRMKNMSVEVLNRLYGGGSTRNSEEIVDPFVDVYECWLFPVVPNDVSLVTGATNLDDAGYPYGVVATMINDYIVKVKKNPFAGTVKRTQVNEDGVISSKSIKIGSMRNPFTLFYWDRLCDEDGNNRIYDCMGIVEQMIPMQFNIDAIRRLIYLNIKTSANPGGIVKEDDLVIGLADLERGPGDLIPIKETGFPVSNSLQLFSGQDIPNGVFAMLESDGLKIKQRVGIRPGVSGQTPQQGTSHTPPMTIGAVQDAAFAPLWEHVKELGFALEDMSLLMDGLMQQFYKAKEFMDVSEHGEARFVEWTERHISANFRREIVAAANTSFFDLDKMNRLAEITAITNEALMSQNPDLIQSTINLLVNTGYPDAYDWIQQLRKKLQEVQMQQQEMSQIGQAALEQGLPQQAAGGNPEQQQGQAQGAGQGDSDLTDEERAGLEALIELTGKPVEELMAQLS